MPTDASEIDEFWTVNPVQYENDDNNKKTKSEDDEILGDEGLLSDDEQPLTEENDQKKKRKHPLLQLTVHRRGFSDCWLAFLKLPLTEEMYKKVLLILHKRILPHLAEPKLLMDFLTDSYNVGGAVSLLALNGLFTLIVDHNL
jgi:U3 small nucleolar RNA-associated protein 19